MNTWLDEVFASPVDSEDSFLKNNYTHNQIFVKDANHCFIGFNKLAEVAGSAAKLESALGKDDYAMTPEFADIYISHGQKALDTQKLIVASAPVHCRFMGWISAEAKIFPILDDKGRSSAIVLAQHIDYSIKKMNFVRVSSAILSGFAKLFIQKPMYLVNLPETYLSKVSCHSKISIQVLGQESCKVYFSRREAECLLYMMFRVPVKTIAHFMGISPKTVEKMISVMSDKMSVHSSGELIRNLMDLHFFEEF